MGRGGGSVCDRGSGSLRFGAPPCPMHIPTHHTQFRGPTDSGGGPGIGILPPEAGGRRLCPAYLRSHATRTQLS